MRLRKPSLQSVVSSNQRKGAKLIETISVSCTVLQKNNNFRLSFSMENLLNGSQTVRSLTLD